MANKNTYFQTQQMPLAPINNPPSTNNSMNKSTSTPATTLHPHLPQTSGQASLQPTTTEASPTAKRRPDPHIGITSSREERAKRLEQSEERNSQ